MPESKSNERTFQGILLTIFNKLREENPSFNFTLTEQEQNVIGKSRFSDTIMFSLFSLKVSEQATKNLTGN